MATVANHILKWDYDPIIRRAGLASWVRYRLPNVMDISPHTGTFYKSWEVEHMMQLDLMTQGTLFKRYGLEPDEK